MYFITWRLKGDQKKDCGNNQLKIVCHIMKQLQIKCSAIFY